MQRLFVSLPAILVGCLGIPANLHAEDAEDYNNRGYEAATRGDYPTAITAYTRPYGSMPNMLLPTTIVA